MRRWNLGIVCGLTAAAALPAPAWAAGTPADQAVLKAIQGARTDAQRAGKLLEAAQAPDTDAPTAVLLLEKAVELGLRGARDGQALQAAREAVGLLAARAPDRAAQWQAMRLDVLRAAWRNAPPDARHAVAAELIEALVEAAAGAQRDGRWADVPDIYREAHSAAYAVRSPLLDWLAFQRLRAMHFAQVADQVRQAEQLLASKPDDAATRQRLLQLLLAEMNAPAAARKFLTADLDQAWRTYLPLIEQDPETLSKAAAAELGRWLFEFLAPKASRYSYFRILGAARACYQRAVVLHRAEDAEGAALRARLRQVEKLFDEIAMDPTPGGRGADIDLLGGLKLQDVQWQGAWAFVSGELTTWPREQAYLRLPATVEGNYRLSVRFANRLRVPVPDKISHYGRLRVSDDRKEWLSRKISEKRGLDIAFPVGARHVALCLEPQRLDTTARLMIVQHDPSDARAVMGGPAAGAGPAGQVSTAEEAVVAEAPFLPTERIHQVDIAVFVEEGVAAITVFLNGEPLIRWKGRATRCVLPDIWPPGDFRNAVVLGGWTGPTCFLSAKICNFDGRTRFDRPEEE